MPILQIKDLHFTYPEQKKEALSGIDWQAGEGTFTVIGGKSGSGKSTLISQLKTELAPNGERRGQIFFRGRLLDSYSAREQSAAIGYVFQDPDAQLVTDKVWHEIAFGLESLGFSPEEMRLRVAEMAAYFGIADRMDEKVDTLSGGQKQLVNLASVMAVSPDLLILDEPTAQLDPVAAADFLDTVWRLHRELGTTVVMTEQRMEDIMARADTVMMMEKGKIVAMGTPEQIGRKLGEKNQDLFLSLPAAMRISHAVQEAEQALALDGTPKSTAFPCDVASGRRWLAQKMSLRENQTKTPGADTPGKYESKKDTSGKMISQNPKKEPICLRAREVSFSYQKKGQDILSHFSLDIRDGEIFALLGGNGSGKSTALKLFAGIFTPQAGNIRLHKKSLGDYTKEELYYHGIGYLPQEVNNVFSQTTVRQELKSVITASETPGDFEKYVETLGLSDLLNRHPYDLSGGEKQRAALAKILLLSPRVLLLDEPTKGMDSAWKLRLGRILRELKKDGVTTVLVSHDLDFCAQFCDRAGLVFDGRVTGEGTAQDFFSGNHFYTTATNRMVRQYFPRAVTVEQAVKAILDREFAGKKNPPKNPDFASGKNSFGGGSADVGQHTENTPTAGTSFPISNDEPPVPASAKSSLPKLGLRFWKRAYLISLPIVTPLVIWMGMAFFDDRRYLAVSLFIALYALIPPLFFFERGRVRVQNLVVIATLSALAVAVRALFYMFPSVKPLAAVVVVAGVGLGAESGFLVGALSMLASNMLFGQGPWTPWQMFSMGLVGLLAGLIFHRKISPANRRQILPVCAYSFVSVIVIYGVIMNVASLTMVSYDVNRQNLLALELSGLPMDFIHGLTTVVFLYFLGTPMLEKIERVRTRMKGASV